MSEALAAGSVVGDYRVEEVIGRGGMGVVYRATQLRLQRAVALKVIAPEVAADPEFRERFGQEARLAARLEHPNVVPIYEAGEHKGLLFIAMRYLEGTDLKRMLREGGPLEPPRAAKLVMEVAEALDLAHGCDIVHRDVKPSNILVADDHAFLVDFGLTRSTGVTAGPTKAGDWVGTLDYAAPEQIRGEPLDPRTDVYALGCVLYEALTGHVPHPRANEVAKMYAHLHDPPPAPSAEVPGLAAFDGVVAKGMASLPEGRYRSAGELGRAAVAAAAGRSVDERDSAVVATAPRKRSRRRYRLAGLLVLLALAGGGVATWTLTRPGPSPPAGSAASERSALLSVRAANDLAGMLQEAGEAAGGLVEEINSGSKPTVQLTAERVRDKAQRFVDGLDEEQTLRAPGRKDLIAAGEDLRRASELLAVIAHDPASSRAVDAAEEAQRLMERISREFGDALIATDDVLAASDAKEIQQAHENLRQARDNLRRTNPRLTGTMGQLAAAVAASQPRGP